MKQILFVLFFTKHGLTLTSDGHVSIQSNDRQILTNIGIFCQNQCLNRRLYLGLMGIFPKKLT